MVVKIRWYFNVKVVSGIVIVPHIASQQLHTHQHAPERPYFPAGHAAQTVEEVPPAARGGRPQAKMR